MKKKLYFILLLVCTFLDCHLAFAQESLLEKAKIMVLNDTIFMKTIECDPITDAKRPNTSQMSAYVHFYGLEHSLPHKFYSKSRNKYGLRPPLWEDMIPILTKVLINGERKLSKKEATIWQEAYTQFCEHVKQTEIENKAKEIATKLEGDFQFDELKSRFDSAYISSPIWAALDTVVSLSKEGMYDIEAYKWLRKYFTDEEISERFLMKDYGGRYKYGTYCKEYLTNANIETLFNYIFKPDDIWRAYINEKGISLTNGTAVNYNYRNLETKYKNYLESKYTVIDSLALKFSSLEDSWRWAALFAKDSEFPKLIWEAKEVLDNLHNLSLNGTLRVEDVELTGLGLTSADVNAMRTDDYLYDRSSHMDMRDADVGTFPYKTINGRVVVDGIVQWSKTSHQYKNATGDHFKQRTGSVSITMKVVNGKAVSINYSGTVQFWELDTDRYTTILALAKSKPILKKTIAVKSLNDVRLLTSQSILEHISEVGGHAFDLTEKRYLSEFLPAYSHDVALGNRAEEFLKLPLWKIDISSISQ